MTARARIASAWQRFIAFAARWGVRLEIVMFAMFMGAVGGMIAEAGFMAGIIRAWGLCQ